MTLVDPFLEVVPTLLAGALRHETTITAHPATGDPFALELDELSLTWDERTAPRVQADIVCRMPADPVELAALDPRTGARVTWSAGYVLPGGARDVHDLANLGVRSWRRLSPGDQLRLSAMSDEALMIDGAPVTAGSVSAASVPAAIQALVNAVLNPDPSFVITHTDKTTTNVVDITDRWTALADLADSIEAAVFDDGLRVWHVDPRPVAASSTSAAVLRVGPGGTITGSDDGIDREDWANVVRLRYRWTDAANVDHTIIGTATTTSGPYAVATAGSRIFTDERETPTTQAAADRAAAAVLRRMLSRSRSFTVTCVAAYWLRPGHTVTVQLRNGAQERHLVSRVTFFPDAGEMTVTTRLPDTLSA